MSPAGTVTEAGTVSTVGTLADSETAEPPAGAAPLSWTVQRALEFGVSVVAEQVSEDGTGVPPGATEMLTAFSVPSREAVTETTWLDAIAPAVNWKLVDVVPWATTGESGRVKRPAGLADNAIRTPPDGAGLEVLTVHVVEPEDSRVVLAHRKEERVMGAVTVRVAVLLVPLRLAMRVGS